MRIRSVSSIAFSMTVAGCSIHPLPKDVTRDTTFSIVEKIRCEVRDALIEQIVKSLEVTTEIDQKSINANKSLFLKIKNGIRGPKFFCGLTQDQVGERTLGHFRRFAANSVAYKFDFNITENKKKAGALSFSMPFTKGTFSLGVGAGSDKSRKNVRSFELGDSFAGLITGYDGSSEFLNCSDFKQDRNKSRRHWIYPITGRIGVTEVVDTYVRLVNAATLKSMTDTLTYTTIIDASVNPKVTLSGIPQKKLRLSEASVDVSAKRTDIHEVKLTLAVPPTGRSSVFTPLPGVENIIGMPPGTQLGFTVKKFKKSAPDEGRLPGCSVLGGPFALSKEKQAATIAAGIAESRRQDALDTSEKVRGIIGK